MPLSDGKNQLVRIMFRWGTLTYNFKINPGGYSETFPQRTSAVKTASKAVVEDFNGDLGQITISGTTGFQGGQGQADMEELAGFLDAYANSQENYGNSPKQYLEVWNYTNGEFWNTTLQPNGYKISQDKDAPILYNYEINLIIISSLGDPTGNDVINQAEVTTQDANKISNPAYNRSTGFNSGTVSGQSNAGASRLAATLGVH